MNFLNVGKANAEIERLKAELSQKDAEAKAHLENATELEKVAEKSQQDSAARIQELEKEVAAHKAASEKAKADAEAHCKDFDAKVEKAAASKSLQITAAQGQPAPIVSKQEPAGEQKAELKGLERVKASFQAQAAK